METASLEASTFSLWVGLALAGQATSPHPLNPSVLTHFAEPGVGEAPCYM